MLYEIDENRVSVFTEADTPILTCCYGDLERPVYLHPIYAPNGQPVTEGEQLPPGLCFTLGTLNGEPIPPGRSTRETVPGTDAATVVTTWRDAEPFLIETWTVAAKPRRTEVQIVDITIALTAPAAALTFAGTTGLSCYVAAMEHRKAANADGRIGESEVNGKTAAWGTLAGITTAEQNALGIAICPHPENGETTFFARDAALGFLFAQTPPFTLTAGATHTLNYRLLAYIGDLFTFDLSQHYEDYITELKR